MRKFGLLSIALTGCIIIMGASGCAKKQGDLSSINPDKNKKYTYTMTRYQTEPNNNDSEIFKAIQEKYNIEIQVWDIDWQNYDEILNLKLAGGEIPDILYTKTPTSAQKYVDQNIATEIPMELFNQHGANILKRINEDAPDTLKYYYINGKLYALPAFSVGAGATGIPMVWRGDWLKNVGINKIPETIDEYEDAFYKFTRDDPDKNGKNDTYALSRSGLSAIFAAYGYLPSLGQTGTPKGFWMDKNGKLVYSSVQPEMKEALKRISKWYKDGVLDPEFITGENKGGYWAISHSFINGRIGFTCHGMSYHWEPQFFENSKPGQDREEMIKTNKQAADNLQITAKPPVLKAGQERLFPKQKMVRYERWMFGSNMGKDMEKFARLIDIYNDIYANKDNYMFASTGEKGKVWEYQDVKALDNKVYKQVVYLNKWKDDKFRQKNAFSFTLFSPSFPEEGKLDTPRNTWAIPRGFDKQYMPVNELQAPLPSEGRYSAELTKLEEEAYTYIIAGQRPIDYFDEFVQKWRQSGGDQLEKEANEWYATVK